MQGDVEGLSIAMFVCAIAGNGFGAVGILVRTHTVQEAWEQLPWLIGMLGTIAMDVFIAWQALRYAQKQVSDSGEDVPSASESTAVPLLRAE